MAKHTPGKWMVDGYEPTIIITLRNKVWTTICKCYSSNGMTTPPKEETQANARLIASAPELLEACKEALVWINPKTRINSKLDTHNEILNFIEQAILKAEGK